MATLLSPPRAAAEGTELPAVPPIRNAAPSRTSSVNRAYTDLAEGISAAKGAGAGDPQAFYNPSFDNWSVRFLVPPAGESGALIISLNNVNGRDGFKKIIEEFGSIRLMDVSERESPGPWDIPTGLVLLGVGAAVAGALGWYLQKRNTLTSSPPGFEIYWPEHTLSLYGGSADLKRDLTDQVSRHRDFTNGNTFAFPSW